MASPTREMETTGARSRNGMVVTPHWQASDAGAAVLRRGGNAIEAVIAAGAALSVLYPHFCGLGGDAVWMVCDASGKVSCLLGIGQAAAGAGAGIREIPLRGAGSILTTACLVDSWQKLLDLSSGQWGGSEMLGRLLEPAIALARDGHAVSPSQRFWFEFRAEERATWPGFSPLFVGDGVQRQPELARTLETIARQGTRTFYEGELAARIARGLADVGSPLCASDFSATEARFADPVSLLYRDVTLFAPPPPTQGITTLGIMGILAHHAISDEGPASAGHYHYLVEAVKQSFLDRQRIGDPDYCDPAPMAAMLDAARLAAKAAAINRGKAMNWPHAYQQGDTAFLAAVDAEGRCACVLQSIYFDWGSGVVVGDTGLLWQNRGAAFSLDSQSPNRLAPGKRPFYTLNPGLALRDGRPHLVYGTQGADGQPQTLALLLSLLIDHGLDPAAALACPRFLLGKTFSDSRDTLKLEENAGQDVFAALNALGHTISPIGALSPLGGQAGVIRIDGDGTVHGAHDPRSDGGAAAL
ncbi:gamma-glutamyltransferase family protein [Rhizobium mongolense]|uniref:gamma-glutamyltransferase family protein n=1 Tax=Rhizobium mongolense TaxID=57676 RepID=UPI003557A8A1